MTENFPSFSRVNPLSAVPIQSVPSGSAHKHETTSLPFPFLNCFKTPCFNEPRPPPDMPNQSVPSAVSVMALTSGVSNFFLSATSVSLPRSSQYNPTCVPIQSLPPRSSYSAVTGVVIRLSSRGDSKRSPLRRYNPPPHVPTNSSCCVVLRTDQTN